MLTDRVRTSLYTLGSLGALLMLWSVVAAVAQFPALPKPSAVFSVMATEAANGDLWKHLFATLARVLAAFTVAMLVGAAIGIGLGLSATANRIFAPWLVVLLNLPALIVIVLAYIWFGLNEAAAIGAVALTKIPNVAVTMREGARALDPQYSEMAKVFRLSTRRRMVDVILPQLQPYFASATRNGIALIWKIVLVAELLGRPNGIGFQIYTSFQLFDVSAIMAYSLAFVAVMLVVELMIVQPAERRAARWRGHQA